jgi:DNA-binding MarR family transcriptional regulator
MATKTIKKKYEGLLKEISQTVFHFKERMRRKLLDINFEMSFEQTMALFLIEANEGGNMSELACRSPRDKTSMTRMIDGLEKNALVKRVPFKTDRRQITIFLTKKGKKKIEEIKSLKPDTLDIVFKGLKAEDLATTIKTLQKIQENLKDS